MNFNFNMNILYIAHRDFFKMVKGKLLTLMLLFVVLFSNTTQGQSILFQQGKWVKIGVTTDGIYQLNASHLQKMGFNLSLINPKNIQLYGNRAGMLPQPNSALPINGLAQNEIVVEGEDDNRFDVQDKILFYGQSPHITTFNAISKTFQHEQNLYSDTTFYFLTVGETLGLRIKNQASVSTTKQITTYDDFLFHEIDSKNILAQAPFAGSGREWVGEAFNNLVEQTFNFNISNLTKNTSVRINTSVVASSSRKTQFLLKANGKIIDSLRVAPIGIDRYDDKGAISTKTSIINTDLLPTLSEFNIGLSFNRDTLTTGIGYLNSIEVMAERALKLYNNQTLFQSVKSLQNDVSQFIINEASNSLKIWDITDALKPINQLYENLNQQVIFGTNTTTLRRFIVFNPNGLLEPIIGEVIKPQNLNDLSVPDLIIVTSALLRTQANRLADFRRQHDNLAVEVVSTEEIYNEFSAGKQDITAIRDFVKYLYRKNPQKLKYLLLFGDASYDYKKRVSVVSEQIKQTYIPTYQSRESLNPIYSYASDDYFGFLEPNEGDWNESAEGSHTLEIGIGRLPVKTIEEAKNVVDKLIYYSTNKESIGEWRNKVVFVADDGDQNLHQEDADYFAKQVEESFEVQKLYLDAYPLLSLPQSQYSPAANAALNKVFSTGALVVNYNGHGAEVGWTDEQILTIKDIVNFTNQTTLPLMFTATCQFGRFDDPNQVSGAELSIINPKGGAIALLTTTRPVYQSTNFYTNKAFYESVFKPINGEMPRLGDIMIYTKNNSAQSVVNRNFSLLGDPSMKLAYPTYQINLANIKGIQLSANDTLKALTKINIKGSINQKDVSSTLIDFNGIVHITVYDKQKTIQTLGNKGSKFTYKQYSSIIFEGDVTVVAGKFTTSFIVPKDINYRYGVGKIFAYAKNKDATFDAVGTSNITVGGAADINSQDTIEPAVQLFLNDKTFVSGNTIGSSSVLIADIYDESGINIATDGLGHEIMLTIDDTTKVVLNDFFKPTTDSYQQGTLHYTLADLSVGVHHLKIKVWDNYNNSSDASLEFKVVDEQYHYLKNVFCYPNPFNQKTTFSFEHDRAGDDLTINIEIYDSAGHLIKTFNKDVYKSKTPFDEISWNLIEDSPAIATGNYFYRIFVKSLTAMYQAIGSGKMTSVK